jgi:hypothetical protein
MPKRTRRNPDERNPEDIESSVLRKTANLFGVYRVCGNAHCLRARDCRGDANACFDRFWPHVPEDDKIWLRVAVTAASNGSSPAEAAAAGEAAARQYREMQNGLGRETEQPSALAAPARPEAPQPRVRMV